MVTRMILVNGFHEAALFLKDQIEHGGWKKFAANYLREHVRCRHGYEFSNTLSPELLDEVLRQHPDLASWIKTAERKQARLF